MKRSIAVISCLVILVAQAGSQSLTDTNRFKYHGYFYKNEELSDKEELWEMLTDAVWLSKKEDIMKAFDTEKESKWEKFYREKYNNEQPLKKGEPDPTKKEEGKKDPTDLLVEQMVEERK